VLYELPVPWSADAVIVEVNCFSRPPVRKADFSIRLPGTEPVLPESLRGLRKGMQELKNLAQVIRSEVQDLKNKE
jgi:hypothetical protein